jgi:hypothetical protein
LTAFLVFWVVAAATHASGLFQPLHCDYCIWLRVARDWHSGQQLYTEAYDHKQPMVIILAGLLDSSKPAVSLFIAETALLAIAAAALFAALMSTLPRAAWMAPLLLIAWTGASSTFYGGQIMEAFALSFGVIALSCCVLAARRGSATLALVGGAAYFLMGSLRLPNYLDGLAYLPFLFWAYRRCGRPVGNRLLASFLIGFAAVGASFLIFAAIDGHLRGAIEVTLFNFQFGALDRVPFSQSLLSSVKVVGRVCIENPLLVLMLMLTLTVWLRERTAASASNRGRARAEYERLWGKTAVCWLVLSYLAAWPGGRHFFHYYHLMWGPACLLSALGIARLLADRSCRRVARLLANGAVAAALIQATVVNVGVWDQWRRKARDETDPRIAVRQAVDYVHESTSPTTAIAAYVSVDNAEFLLLANRPALSYAVPDVLPEERLEEWAQAALNKQGAVIVVDEWFSCRESKSPAFLRLQNRLQTDLTAEESFGAIRIYRMK